MDCKLHHYLQWSSYSKTEHTQISILYYLYSFILLAIIKIELYFSTADQAFLLHGNWLDANVEQLSYFILMPEAYTMTNIECICTGVVNKFQSFWYTYYKKTYVQKVRKYVIVTKETPRKCGKSELKNIPWITHFSLRVWFVAHMDWANIFFIYMIYILRY